MNTGKMSEFLAIQEIPEGKTLTVRYQRTVGLFRGEGYTVEVTTTKELQGLQGHLSEREDTMDAILASEGYKYKIVSFAWS